MNEIEKYMKEKIRLTSEGNWYHGDVEITHERTKKLFFKSLVYEKGKYFLVGEKIPVPVEVEDVGYFIRDINRVGKTDYEIALSDGTKEKLDPTTLDVGAENQLYCDVKESGAKAKFERKVYYELLRDLKEKEGYYGLERDGQFYPIQRISVVKQTTEKIKQNQTKKKVAQSKGKKKVVKKSKKPVVKKVKKKTVKKSTKKKAIKKKKKTLRQSPKQAKAKKKGSVKKTVKKKSAKKATKKKSTKKKTAKKKTTKKKR